MKCQHCDCDYPREMIQPLHTGDQSVDLCPLCARDEVNKTHGMPLDTPFRGPIASGMYDQALIHLQETMQYRKE